MVGNQMAPSCRENSQAVSLKHHQAAVLGLDDVDPAAVCDVEDAVKHRAVGVAYFGVPFPQHLQELRSVT